MIACGSSCRGLSDVTTTRSACCGRGGAHQRALVGIAVAAASEHDHDPACRGAIDRAVGEHAGEGVGRVGVVDDDGERVHGRLD